jgi:pSer/pThr/pTyr-binding forkhead associated (FHA) protein
VAFGDLISFSDLFTDIERRLPLACFAIRMPAIAELPPTAPLDFGPAPASSDAALLDHRTRSLAIRPALARPGSYLALQSGDTTLLIALQRGVTHVGRGLSADFRLEEQHVSRRHALIIRAGDGVVLLDDRSAAGTFVNGRRVERAELHDNDVIGLGPVMLRYVEVVRKPQSPVAVDAGRKQARRSQRAMDGLVASRIHARARARTRSRATATQAPTRALASGSSAR